MAIFLAYVLYVFNVTLMITKVFYTTSVKTSPYLKQKTQQKRQSSEMQNFRKQWIIIVSCKKVHPGNYTYP